MNVAHGETAGRFAARREPWERNPARIGAPQGRLKVVGRFQSPLTGLLARGCPDPPGSKTHPGLRSVAALRLGDTKLGGMPVNGYQRVSSSFCSATWSTSGLQPPVPHRLCLSPTAVRNHFSLGPLQVNTQCPPRAPVNRFGEPDSSAPRTAHRWPGVARPRNIWQEKDRG